MASLAQLQLAHTLSPALAPATARIGGASPSRPQTVCVAGLGSRISISTKSNSALCFRQRVRQSVGGSNRGRVVCAVGDVSADATPYLIAGAALIAIVGTAFPIFFSRKDLCPECDGAGFVRDTSSALRANAARKDLAQIVCKNCNGLGKIGQVDKK